MKNNFNIPTMLTIAQTAKTFNLPEHFVRKAVLTGKTVSVKAGAKYLVNAEKFADFLNAGDSHSLTGNMLLNNCRNSNTGIQRINVQ